MELSNQTTETETVSFVSTGRKCSICSQLGHNKKTCPTVVPVKSKDPIYNKVYDVKKTKDDRPYNLVFTDFEVDTFYQRATTLFSNPIVKCSYLLGSLETCPDTKRQHIQGYVQMREKTGFPKLKRIFQNSALHLEEQYQYSTAERAVQYCKKGEQNKDEWNELDIYGSNYGKNVNVIVELGTLKRQGERTDINAIFKQLNSGVSMDIIADEHPHLYLQYGRGLASYQELKLRDDRPRDFKTEVIVLYGDAGKGKSRFAFEFYDAKPILYDGKFFINYTSNMETVLFDEFRPSKMDIETFLQITDRYPMTINMKNEKRYNWRPKRIIFTTNANPLDTWYVDSVQPVINHSYVKIPPLQVLRRITEIRYFTVGGSPVGELIDISYLCPKNVEPDKVETLEERKEMYRKLLEQEKINKIQNL